MIQTVSEYLTKNGLQNRGPADCRIVTEMLSKAGVNMQRLLSPRSEFMCDVALWALTNRQTKAEQIQKTNHDKNLILAVQAQRIVNDVIENRFDYWLTIARRSTNGTPVTPDIYMYCLNVTQADRNTIEQAVLDFLREEYGLPPKKY